MNKPEAIAALETGKAVTHRFMDEHEFVIQDPTDSDMLLLEDGVKQPKSDFWRLRTEPYWEDGWEEYLYQ